MAIAFVKKTTITDTDGGTSTTISVTSTTGNLLVATCILVNGSSSGAPITSISDSAGNGWFRPSSFSDTNPPANYVGGLAMAICYAENADHVTSITFHYGACSKFIVTVTEFSGAATSSVRHDSDAATASSTPSITTPAHGVAVAAACTSNATSISGGFTTLLNSSGNLAGYNLAGSSSESASMGWSPTQNAACGAISFNAGPTSTDGTATLTESESLTAKATIAPIASLVESEMLSAIAGTVAQAEFSCLAQDQLDDNGIQGRKGLSSYHWSTSLSTSYDRYASLQEGQLVAGGTGAPDLNLYRNSSTQWKTDDSLAVGGDVSVTGTLDAGYVASTSTSRITAASNMTIVTFDTTLQNNILSMLIEWNYTGSTITGSSSGGITDTAVGTLDSAYRPPFDMHAVFGDGFSFGMISLYSNGVLTMRAYCPTATIANDGHTFRCSFSFAVR